MALFMDFENIAIGIEDAKYGKFEVGLILKRFVEKGKILFKRAYANWERYSKYRRSFHDVSIELFSVTPGFIFRSISCVFRKYNYSD